MSLSIYKPNSSGTGAAFSFQVGEDARSREPTFFMKGIKQHSWDSSKKVGNFSNNKEDPTKNISVKFNESECGEIMSAIANRYEFNTFHAYEENKTSIRISPWDKKNKKNDLVLPAWGITVTRNGSETFKLPLDPGESLILVELIKSYLSSLFEFRQNKFKKAPF